jgi:reactive intermediate/imine deaminase
MKLHARLLAASAALLFTLDAPAATPAPEFTDPSGGKAAFSEVVRFANVLYISGQVGMKPGVRELVPGGIQPETRATLEYIKAAVEQHGSSMERVLKCTVFLADLAEWPAMNEIYVTFFPKGRPARSAVEVSGLVLGARVEIECMAAVG